MTRRFTILGVPIVLVGALGGCQATAPVTSETAAADTVTEERGGAGVPVFEFDETWPQLPLPKNWLLGTVVGVDVDENDHIWIAQRADTLRPDEFELERGRGDCCQKAPYIIEFDYDGNVVQSWGGPSPTGEFDWPTPGEPSPDPNVGGGPNGMHSVFVDHADNVWLTGTGTGDGQLLKFKRSGEFLLQVGRHVDSDFRFNAASNDTSLLNAATGVAGYAPTDEIFVSDGYGNRRVIVFDGSTGEYKRHWGAYGEQPDDSTRWAYDANSPNPQFNTPHGIAVSQDGFVYVADRNNSRIQVFEVDGTYVAEKFIELHTMSGTAFGVALSPGPDERYLYVPDGRNEKVWILERETLQLLGSFGCPGHAGGCMTTPHSIATDSRGNVYIGETWEGKRVQRFLYKGLRPQS